MDAWLNSHLVCPRDHAPLAWHVEHLSCPTGHRYPLVDGIPILLVAEAAPTHRAFLDSLRAAPPTPLLPLAPSEVDPFVQQNIVATNGLLYAPLKGQLPRYPIPDLPLPPGEGRTLLDIGCNWGRWCLSAARAGYRPVGIDPSLEAIRAARRVAQQLGLPATYLVADARYLPFAPASFEVIFSYSVLQHFAKANARAALAEVGRVLAPGGEALIQMPNRWGLRNLYNQAVKRWQQGREERLFDVRYWTPPELARTFHETIGPTTLTVDGFFSLNPQMSDRALLPRHYRLVVEGSDLLRRASHRLPWLLHLADSLYLHSRRP